MQHLKPYAKKASVMQFIFAAVLGYILDPKLKLIEIKCVYYSVSVDSLRLVYKSHL